MTTKQLISTTTRSVTWRDHLRIVWALARKDIVDALKNKTTLTTILIVALMVLFYRYFPGLTERSDTLRVFVHPGQTGESSPLLAALERSPALSIYHLESTEHLADVGSDTYQPELELTLPAVSQADLSGADADPLVIDGRVMYWLNQAERAELQSLIQEELALEFERPVIVNLAAGDGYYSAEGGFFAFNATIALIFVTVMVGISMVPNLMLAEKRDKTLDVLRVSPATAAHLVAGKALAGLFYCAAGSAIVLIIFGYLILQWELALLAALLGTLFTVALGLIVGSLVSSPAQLQLIAWPILIPLLFPVILIALEGLVPASVLAVLRWVPTVSVVKIFRLSFTPDALPVHYAADLAAVVSFTLILFVLVVWVVRRQERT